MKTRSTEPEPDAFTLTLKAKPGNWLTPPVARLRYALKFLGRRAGLRCVSCVPTAQPDKEPTCEPKP